MVVVEGNAQNRVLVLVEVHGAVVGDGEIQVRVRAEYRVDAVFALLASEGEGNSCISLSGDDAEDEVSCGIGIQHAQL